MKEQFQIFLESSQQFLNEIALALPKIQVIKKCLLGQ